MTKKTKAIFNKLIFSGIILAIILIMQPLEVWLLAGEIPVLFPHGIIGVMERDLLLFIQVVMLFFVIPVYILTFIFSWWYRADNTKAMYDPHLVDHKVAEFIWWGFPFFVTVIVCVITFFKTHELDPYRPIPSDAKPLVIEVVALQWKWLFIYPEEKIATVNFIQFPKDRPVRFEITADAPMNSFWIPRLGGQIYAMPGMRTLLHLVGNREGEYRGSSANISGKGFSGMVFTAKVSSEDEYRNWVGKVQQSSNQMNIEEYRKVAEPSEYVPVSLYRLADENLFQEVIMKFMDPKAKLNS